MSPFALLEKNVLNLPPEEREQLALIVWESIEEGAFPDSESIETALRWEQEIEFGEVRAISHEEFIRRTSGSE